MYLLSYNLAPCLSIHFLFLSFSLSLSLSLFLFSFAGTFGDNEGHTFIVYYASRYVHVCTYMYWYPLSYDLAPSLSIHFLSLSLSLSFPAGIFCNTEGHTFIVYYASRYVHVCMYLYCYPLLYNLAPCHSIHFLFLLLSLFFSLSFSLLFHAGTFGNNEGHTFIVYYASGMHINVCTSIGIPSHTI